MRKRRILVVDDEVELTHLLKLNLEATGAYEVQEENDSRAAVETARRCRPDLIFLDIRMPGLGGGAIAAQLKMDEQLRSVPVVFLTGMVSSVEADVHNDALKAQVFLAKPAHPQQVIDCIERYLQPSASQGPAT